MAVATSDQIFREVMTFDPPEATTPFEVAHRDFVYGRIWSRPELGRRERRLVTLTCVAAADAPQPIIDHVYAALSSGDLSLEEMLEAVLHFAVYCGWPKASHLEGVIRMQHARVQQERGHTPAPWPARDDDTLGINDWRAGIARGAEVFTEVNLVPAPVPDTPYTHAGILGYVFGHLWQRPGLSRRDRRFVTVACVAVCDAPIPLNSHVTSALHSGDISKQEMDELVLHLSAYSGFAKGEALRGAVEDAWARAGSDR
ncbi:4-carboxymuconolactone decarboxylase [Thermocatellispora tengchongensis]|uniref:4-carboxymuconolactone decarboxylase n=1 Tax=Thermocatellispora tengchongensis TaxID=1073253 RepID=A0A840P7Q8_9ACTN|nr:carboxymuconolactone decarboxylase family protein [Thermocatellispora tengchongensis]MBB5137384.1 4-carboxymuconolactone decarboxylase [Thermocatellispora tengchongensis]